MSNPKTIKQDDHYIALNKPSGWIVNEASTTGDTPVIQTWLEKNFSYEISQNKEFRSGVVHRLDKETSGVLLIAKDKNTFRSIQEQFKKRSIKKTYLALVHGFLEPDEGSVDVPVGRLPWNRERFGVLPGGRKAQSKYSVKDYYKKDDKTFSLVEVFPRTGRTHQIRIHMKYLGHPLVSDEFYAGRKTSRSDRKWCSRMFLHAYSISFDHPKSKKRIKVNAELPKTLLDVLNKLSKVEG